MKTWLHAVTLCITGIAAVQGQEAAKPAGKEVLREKTIYVPFEKLESVFEKEGRGIFLPYEEFLKLWNAGQPKPPAEPPDAPPVAAVIRGGSYVGSVSGTVARFKVAYQIEALKKGWSELALPLRGVAVESVDLSSPKALFSFKDGQYVLFLPEPGRYEINLAFSARVQVEPGKKTVSFGIPPTAVSRLDLTLPEEEPIVEVEPVLAVTQTAPKEKETQVLAFLGNSNVVTVKWLPRAGKAGEDAPVLLAEQSLRVFLGERILKISTDVSYQALRGEASSFRISLPAGMRLLSVKGDDIREWREEGGAVLVRRHSPLKAAAGAEGSAGYRLSLGFERILDETPPTLPVSFPRVEDVSRESGWVMLSQEPGLNVRVTSRAGLSQLDPGEVPEALRATPGIGFRYLAHPLKLDLGIEKILPVVRSSTTSVVVLGRDEDVWLGWIDYSITRAGVFRLEFRVPARWTVASVGDPAAVEGTETTEAGGARTIAVSLKSKALGELRLPFRLTAPGSGNPGEMVLAPPVVVGSTEDRGLIGASAPRSIDLQTAERKGLVPADVDALFRSGIMGQVGTESGIPLTYGYRDPAGQVSLRLVARKTEIDLLAQHLVEIGDGGIKVTHLLDYEVLFAAADRVAFTSPSALDSALKVEAKEKKEVRKTPAGQGRTLWEVLLQAPALGNVSVTVTQEEDLKALESGKPVTYAVPILEGAGVRAVKGFLGLEKSGTLEVAPRPAALESIDAGDLPDKLRRGQIYGAFRYFAPGAALTLALTKYDDQVLARTVVSLARLKSVLSDERKLKTRATLLVQNAGEQYLELTLPAAANVLSVSVAGKPQPQRRRKDGGGTLIGLPTSAGQSGTFPVVIVYEEPVAVSPMGVLGGVGLRTIEVQKGVPVMKVEMDLYLPPDYAYLWFRGSLKEASPGSPTLGERFQRLWSGSAGSAAAATVPPPAAVSGGKVDLEIPTGDHRLYRFETLAPGGDLRFGYVSRPLYSFADLLTFVAAMALGIVLLRWLRWPLLRSGVVLVFLPLALLWFSTGAAAEIAGSALAGGALVWTAGIAGEIRKRSRERGLSRLAAAPDPYLEEAPPKPKKKPPQEPPQEPPPPPKGGGKAT